MENKKQQTHKIWRILWTELYGYVPLKTITFYFLSIACKSKLYGGKWKLKMANGMQSQ